MAHKKKVLSIPLCFSCQAGLFLKKISQYNLQTQRLPSEVTPACQIYYHTYMYLPYHNLKCNDKLVFESPLYIHPIYLLKPV